MIPIGTKNIDSFNKFSKHDVVLEYDAGTLNFWIF